MEHDSLINRQLFNFDLLIPDKKIITELGLKEVTKPNIKIYNTDNFHEEGLYSTLIFGDVGSENRKRMYGYIDLKLPVLHPLVYKHVCSLKKVYKEIISGRTYAIFNEDTKDLDIVEDTTEGSRTGMTFFLEVLPKMKFVDNESIRRRNYIQLVEKYAKEEKYLRYLIVMPAGFREYTVNKKGIPSEDQINSIYRKILLQANYLSNTIVTNMNITTFDSNRYILQEHIYSLFQYIVTMLDGKHKFIQEKWGSRVISFGTRNVASPQKMEIKDLRDPRNFTSNHTVLGVHQTVVAFSPLIKRLLHDQFIMHCIFPNDDLQMLINKETLKTEKVTISRKVIEKWTSTEGLDDILNKLENDYGRNSPVLIDGYYLALAYEDGNKIEVILNTDLYQDLPKEKLRPMTYGEIFYILCSMAIEGKHMFITRYPAIEQGSIYPSKIYLMSTVKGRDMSVFLHGRELKLKEYPIIGNDYIQTMSPHNSRLDGLKCDFDGDTLSGNSTMTDEANEEIKNFMNDPKFYLTPNGKLLSSVKCLPLDLVVAFMSEK